MIESRILLVRVEVSPRDLPSRSRLKTGIRPRGLPAFPIKSQLGVDAGHVKFSVPWKYTITALGCFSDTFFCNKRACSLILRSPRI
jgi:hypothetical protein